MFHVGGKDEEPSGGYDVLSIFPRLEQTNGKRYLFTVDESSQGEHIRIYLYFFGRTFVNPINAYLQTNSLS